MEECWFCGGRGRLPKTDYVGNRITSYYDCPVCDGEGYLDSKQKGIMEYEPPSEKGDSEKELKLFKFWTYTPHLDEVSRYVIALSEEEAAELINNSLSGKWILSWVKDIEPPMIV